MSSGLVLDLIASRHCRRAFLPDAVDADVLKEVLRSAANAPSSQNTQSWQVAVVTGDKLAALSRWLCAAFDGEVAPKADYPNRPNQLDDVLKRRQDSYGTAIFAHHGIARTDEPGRREHRRRNFVFFDAPVELIFHLPINAVAGNFVDMGCFMQNVMLGLSAHGLGSCPQFSVASYSSVVHEVLGWSEPRCIVAGMAVGRFDATHPHNQFVPPRAELAEFCHWYD